MNITKIKEYLLYAGVSREEYHQVLPDIQKSNRSRLLVYLSIAMSFLIIMILLSFRLEVIKSNLYIYGSVLCILLVIFMITLCGSKTNTRLLSGMIHSFIASLFLLGILIGTVTNKNDQATTVIVFLLTLPMIFTQRPLENIGMILFFDSLHIITTIMIKTERVIPLDVINAVVFGCISMIVSSYMMKIMVENYTMKHKFSVMAKTDQLTTLKNRNWYEHQLETYPALCKESLTCIYVDVNELHEFNNTKGHAAGDAMLQFVAKEFQTHFGEEDTYRIGGDEYVAFAVDMDESLLAQKVESFLKKVEENQYHAAIGHETQTAQQIEMSELIKRAEKKMYQAKSSFYKQRIHDRRRN